LVVVRGGFELMPASIVYLNRGEVFVSGAG
jgi:hypothetical protein